MLPLLRHGAAGGDGDDRGPDQLRLDAPYREFTRRREGMCFALEGGVWLHRHAVRREPMAHLVSSDKERLLVLGRALGLHPAWLQYKPLKDPRTGLRVPAWHWDLWGTHLKKLDPKVEQSDA